MALLTVQDAELLGGNPPTLVAAASSGGDTWLNTTPEPNLYVAVSTAAVTMTVTTKNACEFGTHPDWTLVIQPGGLIVLGPFNAARFTGADGLAKVTFSTPANVQLGVVRPRKKVLTNA